MAPSSVDASSLLVPGVMLDTRSMVPPGDCGSNITYTTHIHTRTYWYTAVYTSPHTQHLIHQ